MASSASGPSTWRPCRGAASAKYLAVFAVIAILTSALTLASFIKFFGVSFLSRTSTLVTARAAEHGRLEVGWTMQLPQVALALACVLLGVVPAIGFRLMQLALDASSQGYGAALAKAAPMQTGLWAGVEQFQSTALFAPLVFAAGAGLDVPGGPRSSRSSAARRAGPPPPGSAATSARPIATATRPTTSTARSNATSAGSAAPPRPQREPNHTSTKP